MPTWPHSSLMPSEPDIQATAHVSDDAESKNSGFPPTGNYVRDSGKSTTTGSGADVQSLPTLRFRSSTVVGGRRG
jgi:hypothetical protein